MFSLPCVIFAGGKSSRMGRDKSLLPFGRYPTLAQFQYDRLQSLFSDVYLSAKSADKFDFDAKVIKDPEEDVNIFAPTAGFVSAFQSLDSDKIFVLSVDTPFVGETEISELLAADTPELDAVIARTHSGSHPMCGIYHRSLLRQFESMLKEDKHRLGMLLKSSHTHFVDFKNEGKFANLNHPHEYEAALRKL
ncbi:MAG: molybdenum cofactor guanylyltransferase MobA [Epsilonproteobacteria bacterium]|nr:MAG: molybdenum cofactor guanylyltransferase MobA [Campylobacterota bacterium]